MHYGHNWKMKNVHLFMISSDSYVSQWWDNQARHGDESESAYLPYSLGLLQSYALTDDKIRNEYYFEDIEIFRKPYDEVLGSLDNPSVVAASNYIWNTRYHLNLLKKIKYYWPDCLIIVGGPSVWDKVEWYNDHQYIDVAVLQEGEETFANILKSNIPPLFNYNEVPGIIFKDNNTFYKTDRAKRISDVNDIPSPYLTGIFDSIIENNKNTEFYAPIESNRGCPFKCTFCDWGTLTHQKMKMFNLDRVKAEFDWCGDTKILGIFLTDSNTGMFKRDVDVIKHFAKVYRRTGYPKYYNTSGYSKTPMNKNFVGKIQKELNDLIEVSKKNKENHNYTNRELNAGSFIHVSLQTTNEETLKNVKRKNFAIANSDLLEKNNKDIPFAVEFMFPLPGQTYQTMKDDMEVLLRQETASPRLHPTLVLPKTEMNSERYIKEHELEFIKVPYNYEPTSQTVLDVDKEFCIIIKSTKTCSEKEIRKSWTFYWVVISFWYSSILKYTAKTTEKLCDIKPIDFFDMLTYWMSTTDGWLANNFYKPIYDYVLTSYYSLKPDHRFNNKNLIMLSNNLDNIYKDVIIFLKDTYDLSRFEIDLIIDGQINIIEKTEIRRGSWEETD